jgi:hypothetical protein
MGYRTDRQRVQGLGTAGEGTEHWWRQRLTAIALVPLALFFIFTFARNLGADFETVRGSYASPFNAMVAILFILVGFYHLQQAASRGPSREAASREALRVGEPCNTGCVTVCPPRGSHACAR